MGIRAARALVLRVRYRVGVLVQGVAQVPASVSGGGAANSTRWRVRSPSRFAPFCGLCASAAEFKVKKNDIGL